MNQKLIIIRGMSYAEYRILPNSEIVTNAIYLLTNGMIFINGEKYGSDMEIVNEFPVSPIPHVIYMNATTMEQKVWINDNWCVLQPEFSPLSNREIDNMFKDEF